MHINIYEIFVEYEDARGIEAKKNVLRKYAFRNDLRQVLQLNYHPDIGFDIKELPVWRRDDTIPPGMGYETMHSALDKMYLFVAYHPRKPAGLTAEKQSQILVQILESMELKEAAIFGNIILKNLNVKGLTYQVVKDIFPDILS